MENAKPDRQKPAYCMASNCAFMIRRAWRDCKSVLVIALGIILCGVGANLLELFAAPAVLDAIGRGAGPGELIGIKRIILKKHLIS